MQRVVAGAIMVCRDGWGEVAGECTSADGTDALRPVADTLQDFGEAASLREGVSDEVGDCGEEGVRTG